MFFYKESDHAKQITKTKICSASAFFCFILHLYKIYTKLIFSISHLEIILKMGSLKNSPLLARRSSHWEVFCKMLFFFARSPYCGHWLTCFGRKVYFHQRLLFLPTSFYQRYEKVHSTRNLDVVVQEISSEQVHFPGYSVTQQNSSIYQVNVNTSLSVHLG